MRSQLRAARGNSSTRAWRLMLMRVVRAINIAILLAIAIGPIYWLVTMSTLSQNQIVSNQPRLFPTLHGFGGLTTATGVPLFSWIENSLLVAVGTAILSAILGTFAGYGFSRFRFRGASFFGFLVFATQMLPAALLVVPLYAIFDSFHLINNLVSLILVDTAFAMPIAIWIVKGTCDSLPFELDEAAKIDGASSFGVLRRVLLPLLAPGLAAAGIMAFLAGWNDFLFATTFMVSSNKWTVTKGLASLFGQYSVPISLIMAAATLFCIPPIIFFLLLQKRIVNGLTAGAVKA